MTLQDGILVSLMISPDDILVTGCLDWMALWPPAEDVTGVRGLIGADGIVAPRKAFCYFDAVTRADGI